MNFTDPLQTQFTVNPYTANGLRFPTQNVLASGASSAKTSLLWYGKGSANYGERVQENVLHLLENFAGATAPANPVSGQLWFDRRLYFHDSAAGTTGGWYQWTDNPANPNGGTWSAITVYSGTGVPVTTSPPQNYYIDTGTNTFYQFVTVSGHPLYQQWIARGYVEENIGGVPDPADVQPQQRLMVQTYARASMTDDVNWIAVSDVWASTIPPADPVQGTLWYDTSGSPVPTLKIYNDITQWSAVVGDYVLRAGDTMTGTLILPASTSGFPSLNIPHGTAPVAPTDGDMWSTNTGVFIQINGVIKQLDAVTGYLTDLTDVTVAAPQEGHVLRYDSGSPAGWYNSYILWSDILAGGSVAATAAEINHLTGVSSNIQTQFNGKLSLSGGTMTGQISMTNQRIVNLGTPVNPTDAVTKQYVDTNEKYVISAFYDGDIGQLTLLMTDSSVIQVSGFSNTLTTYTPQPEELLGKLPLIPTSTQQAIHDLDTVLERRTTFTREVSTGHTGTALATPDYEVGSNKLFVFVDGLKRYANTRGYQRVLFSLDPLGSPATPDFLDCEAVDPALPESGGSPSFLYSFDVVVDGGAPQTITIDSSQPVAFSFCSIVAAINAQMTGATAVLEDSAIVIYSDSDGTGSSIAITDGTVGSPNFPLFANMQYYNSIEAASAGVTYHYSETSGGPVVPVGGIETGITFTAALTAGQVVEVIVCGQTGYPFSF